MIILMDQDAVLADFDRAIYETRLEAGLYAVPPEDSRSFYMADAYPESMREEIKEIYNAPGFILNLKPVPGAIEAFHQIAASGHELFICTSPLSQYNPCVVEKLQWVEKHLGKQWTKRTVIAKDKTLVNGDILVDDRPQIEGVCEPNWEQVLFDRPYNRDVTEKRRILNWTDGAWRKILDL